MNIVLLKRPENTPFTDFEKESFTIVSTFDEILFESSGIKRKIEENESNEV